MPPGSGAGAGCASVFSRVLIEWVFAFARGRGLRVLGADASEGWALQSRKNSDPGKPEPSSCGSSLGRCEGGGLFPSPAFSSLPQFPSKLICHLPQERVLPGHSAGVSLLGPNDAEPLLDQRSLCPVPPLLPGEALGRGEGAPGAPERLPCLSQPRTLPCANLGPIYVILMDEPRDFS